MSGPRDFPVPKARGVSGDSCQGEERDVIIYSLVATPLQDKLAYIFPKSLDDADEVDHALRLQRLNVGFSRAKERIHFFHSMPLDAYRGAHGDSGDLDLDGIVLLANSCALERSRAADW
jgi:hypothetical protein